MQEVRLKAPAKINLTFDIISKRADGYHNISSVMQNIALCDDVLIRKSNTPGIRLLSNLPNVPRDKNNLVYKIIEDLIQEFEIKSGVVIKLFKRIPLGAGLAGGSSDCATALIGMKKLFKLPITTYGAYNICKRYGSDVPFCFMRGTVLVTGNGSVLKKLPDHPSTVILLAVPKFFMSTTKVYKNFDKNFEIRHKENFKLNKILKGLKIRNKKRIAENLYNEFEEISSSLCWTIREIKQVMLDHGALGASMSGSGPTVFGYYETFNSAQKSIDIIKKNFPSVSIMLTHTCQGII